MSFDTLVTIAIWVAGSMGGLYLAALALWLVVIHREKQESRSDGETERSVIS